MSEYIVELDSKHSIALKLAFAEEMRGGDFVREEIVRCRDCAYSIHFFHHDDERWQCAEPYQDGVDVKSDAYCWRGERKEGGE